MTQRAPWLRPALLILLAAWTLLPLAELVAWSAGGAWFYPALVPAGWSTTAWRAFSTDATLSSAFATSLVLAILTGVTSAAIGFAVARAVTNLSGAWRHAALALLFVPVAVAPTALGVGLQYTALRLGIGGTIAGVWLAHSVPALGYTALYFVGILAVYDPRVEEDARSLGARPRTVLARITIPLHRRAIAEAFVLGFLVSWAQVPLTLLVGQGAVQTLATIVLVYVNAGQDHLAAASGLLLAVPGMLVMLVVGSAARRFALETI